LLGKARTFKYTAAHLDTLAQAVLAYAVPGQGRDCSTTAGSCSTSWPATGTSFGSGRKETTAKRELDLFIKAVPAEANKLVADTEAQNEKDVAASQDPDAARLHIGGEMYLLRTARHIVLADMARQLA
jgi:hypothetical protein